MTTENTEAMRAASELLRIFQNNLGPNRYGLSLEDLQLWDRAEETRAALSQAEQRQEPVRTGEVLTDEDVKASHGYQTTRDKGCFHAGALWAQQAILSKQAKQEPVASLGWVTVPVEATTDMLAALERELDKTHWEYVNEACYRALLAAAPPTTPALPSSDAAYVAGLESATGHLSALVDELRADSSALLEAAEKALAVIERCKPLAAYGRPGTRDVEQAEFQRDMAETETALRAAIEAHKKEPMPFLIPPGLYDEAVKSGEIHPDNKAYVRYEMPKPTPALLEAAENYLVAMDAYTKVVRSPLTAEFDKAAADWAAAESKLRAAIEAYKKVGINGLTEAETAASASVMGLTKKGVA